MTVGAGYAPAVYAGNGVTYAFSFPWPIHAANQLVVELTAGGVTTTLTNGVHYLLTWIGVGSAGSVRIVYMDGGTPVNDPPAFGETLTISRAVPISQETDIRNRGPFLAEVVERALDRQAMISQQLSAGLDAHANSHLPGGSRAIDWSRVLGRGALVERPDAGPEYADCYFFASDEKDLYQCDGSIWVRLDLGSSSGTGIGAISVKEFGAKGDGLTDDTAAMQAAVTAANGKQSVYIPSGTYRIAGQINIDIEKTTIYGDGNTSILIGDGANKSPYVFYSTADDVAIHDLDISAVWGRYLVVCEGCARQTFSRLRFLRTETGSRTGIFIYKNTSDVVVDGCQFYGQSWAALATGGDITGNVDGSIDRVTIRDCYFYENGEAIDINWDTHNVLINGNTFIDNNPSGSDECIDVGGGTSPHDCTDILIVNNNFTCSTPTICVHIKFATLRTLIVNNTFTAPQSSGSLPYCLWIEGDSQTVEVANNNLSGFGRGIGIGSGCRYIKVIGNTIKDPWGSLISLQDVNVGRVEIENNSLIQVAGSEDMIRLKYGIFVKITGNKIVGRVGRNCLWFNATFLGPTIVASNQFIGGNQHIKMDAGAKNVSVYNNGFSRSERESIALLGSNDNVDIVGNQFHEWSAESGNVSAAIADAGGYGRSISDNTFFNDGTTVGNGGIAFSSTVYGAVVSGNRFGRTITGPAISGTPYVNGVISCNYDASASVPISGSLTSAGYTLGENRMAGRASAGTGMVEELTPAQCSAILSAPIVVAPPSSPSDPGSPGNIAQDGAYLYVCVATNTWLRSALATWTYVASKAILTRSGNNMVTRSSDRITKR